MSERLSVTIRPTDDEWETMLAPFKRQGAKDPLIAELRESLHIGDPDWVGKARDGGGNLAGDRLQQLADAAQAKADKIASLPEGPQRDQAHAAAADAAQAAKKLLAELNFAPSGGHRTHDHDHVGVG